jgi:hypothetical protein
MAMHPLTHIRKMIIVYDYSLKMVEHNVTTQEFRCVNFAKI